MNLEWAIIVNCISAVIWTVTISVLGYAFGHAMEAVLEDIKHYEIVLMAGLAVIIYATRRWLNRKKQQE